MAHTTLRQIKIFDTVARYESHTRAANQLHMTQPAVSMQMKQLEANLGVDLFERQGKRLRLTKIGNDLRAYSNSIIQSYQDLQNYVEEVKGCQNGQLVISVATTANHFITRILAEFSRNYPDINISLDVTNRKNIIEQLERHEPDIVIMGEPPGVLKSHSEPLMPNPLVIIAPLDHPLVGKKNLLLDDIKEENFVVREEGSGTRYAIERHFKEQGYTCCGTLEMSSNEAIKQAVSAGFGLGVVSLHTIELELKGKHLAVLDIKGFPIQRHWHIVTRSGGSMSPIARVFRSFLLDEGEKYVSGSHVKDENGR